MERILLSCDGVVNEIVVFGSTDEEHNRNLKQVVTVLQDNNVLLNKQKCIYNAKSIEFLGHILSPNGIRPLNKYVDAIKSFREPKTVSEVQSFLGLVNYISKWIPDLVTLTDPIRKILKHKLQKHADITNIWQNEQKRDI